MWPTLISVGPLAIKSFGFLIAIGIFLGGLVLWQRGREEGFDEEELMDSWLAAGVVGLVLGRVWFVLSHWPEFGGSWYRMIFLTKFPGLSYEGVWLGAILALTILALKKKWNVWRFGETAVFGLLMAEMAGWLGSFLAGSSLGKPTNWFWGIGFPGAEGRRHPVQLLFWLASWCLYGCLKKWEKEYRGFKWYQGSKGEAKAGFVLGSYFLGLGAIHFGLGWLKQDRPDWLGIVMMVTGGLILLLRSGIKGEVRQKTRKVKPSEPKQEKLIKRRKVRKDKTERKRFDYV